MAKPVKVRVWMEENQIYQKDLVDALSVDDSSKRGTWSTIVSRFMQRGEQNRKLVALLIGMGCPAEYIGE